MGCHIVVKIADDNRHGIKPCQLAAALAPVSSDQLIATVRTGTGNRRDEHAMLADTVCSVKHTLIVHDLERMIGKGMQLREGNLLHLLALLIRAALLGGEQVID